MKGKEKTLNKTSVIGPNTSLVTTVMNESNPLIKSQKLSHWLKIYVCTDELSGRAGIKTQMERMDLRTWGGKGSWDEVRE